MISAKNKRKLEAFDDLLEACEAAMPWLWASGFAGSEFYVNLLKAIAKAKGEKAP